MIINEISNSLGAFSMALKKDPEFAPDILHMNAIFCQLKTIKKALEHLVKGGCLYVVVYIGHDQGKESTNLDAYFRTLDHKLYNVAKFEMMNKNNSPYVVIIEKR